MAVKKIKPPKVSNKRPIKNAESGSTVKTHNAGRIKPAKAIKAVNSKSNYGVKDSK